MFSLPLSLRESLSLVPSELPFKTDLIVHNDTLIVLILTPTYLELLQIPLDGSPEKYEVKAINPLDGCLCIRNGVLCVYALHKDGVYEQGVYAFHQGLSECNFLDITISNISKIKSHNNIVILFTNNTFYRVEEGLTKLNISPYFTTIVSFELTHNFIIYKTPEYISIYTTEGKSVVKKFQTRRNIYVDNDKLIVEDNNNLIVYNSSLEQTKRINVQLPNISSVRFFPSTLLIAGDSYLYLNGVVYKVSSSICSITEYKENYFCVSRESIYFIPKGKEVPINLTGREKIAIENILKNKYSPFVTRTFKCGGGSSEGEIGMDMDIDGGTLDTQLEDIIQINTPPPPQLPNHHSIPPQLPPLSNTFLSLLVWQALKIQITKTICNTLNYIKKRGRGKEYLNLLYSFYKLPPKAYRGLRGVPLDYPLLFTNFYSNHIQINHSLFLKCLQFSFFPVNLNFKGRQKEIYNCLLGIERYRKGLWVGDKVNVPFFTRVLKGDYLGLFFLYRGGVREGVVGEDVESRDTNYGIPMDSSTPPLSSTPISTLHPSPSTTPPFDTLKILIENLKKYQKERKIKIKWTEKDVVGFVREGLGDRLIGFIEGEYELVEGINREVLEDSRSNTLYIEKGLKYLYARGDFKRVARLLYEASKRSIKVEEKYYEMVGDYVFVEDQKFIGV